MSDFQTADFASFDAAHLLEELSDLALQLELVGHSVQRRQMVPSKFQAAYGRGPRIEHQLTVFNPQRLKAAEPELIHRYNEAPFRR